MLPEKLQLNLDASYLLADGSNALRATYAEESQLELHGYSATIIADTLRPQAPLDALTRGPLSKLGPERITTFVVRFPRCILAELNTHRVFSRNSASSRARSIKVVIGEVMEDPYVPIFTENQRGMSGPIVSPEVQAAARIEWLKSRDLAVAGVLSMLFGREIRPVDLVDGGWRELTDYYYKTIYLAKQNIPGALNLHKQNINRLLEPYMWHEAVVTATEWTNFLQLRVHEDADPAIHGIAKLMDLALEASDPVERILHAPFAGELVEEFTAAVESGVSGLPLLRLAFAAANYTAGAAAQVSYRPVGDGGTGADPQKLANRLLAVSHLSPFEHAAFSADWAHSLGIRDELVSNLSGEWVQHRALIWYLEKVTGATGLEAVANALS